MLLKRIAKINIKRKIESYLEDDNPKTLAAQIFKPKSKTEILDDLRFYARYCLEHTVNADARFIRVLEEILAECRKKKKDLGKFLAQI